MAKRKQTFQRAARKRKALRALKAEQKEQTEPSPEVKREPAAKPPRTEEDDE